MKNQDFNWTGQRRTSHVLALALVALWVGAVRADDGAEHQTWQDRPISLGVSGGSIEHFRIQGRLVTCCGGTAGGLVQDAVGNLFILSNNHILARINDAVIGEDVIQPAIVDDCFNLDPTNAVADLSDFVPLDFEGTNVVDAAIAQIRDGQVDPSGAILDIGPLGSTTLDPFVGLAVKKSGRTTGLTFGQVLAVDVSLSVRYAPCGKRNGPTATFTNQIRIGADFSAGGDSGSVIVEDVANSPRAVGLLFAGAADNSSTFANPMSEVLSALNVSMVGGTPPEPCDSAADCNDGDACTIDACSSGVCSNTPINCDDGDPCTADSCSGGTCVNDPIPGCGGGANVDCITYRTSGGRGGTKNLLIDISVLDDVSNPVAGASVTIDLKRDGVVVGRGTGTTGSDGTVSFMLRNAADGCYETDVTAVVATGLAFDGSEPVNGFQKGVDPTPDADCRSGSDLCGTSNGAEEAQQRGDGLVVDIRRVRPDPVAMQAARDIKRRNEAALFAIDDVVGVGIGRSQAGDPVIEVYLAKDTQKTRAKIPAKLENVPVRVVVTGPIVAY